MSKEEVISSVEKIFDQADEAFDELFSGKNIPIPVITAVIANKNSWTEKQVRLNDPIVRFYFNSNKKYLVVMGANGGINLTEHKTNVELIKMEKKEKRILMKNEILKKLDI